MFERSCSECSTPIAADAHHAKTLCSNRCAVRRHRRLRKESSPTQPYVSNQQLQAEVSQLKAQILDIVFTMKELFGDKVAIVYEGTQK